jgi:hypothetical protein
VPVEGSAHYSGMNLPTDEALRSASLGSTSTRGAASAASATAMDDQSHRGRGPGSELPAAAGGGGSSAADRVLTEQHQALQAMEGMSLASPFRRGAPSATAPAVASGGAAVAADLASWNSSRRGCVPPRRGPGRSKSSTACKPCRRQLDRSLLQVSYILPAV